MINDKETRRVGILLGLLFAIIAAAYLFTPSWLGSNYILFTNIIYQLPLILAVATAFNLVRIYGPSSDHGQSFTLIALAVLSWLIAEIMWVVYESVLQVELIYPSWASLFFLAGYVFMFFGFIKEWRLSGSKMIAGMWWPIGFVSVAMVAMMFKLSYDPTATSIANVVNLAYNIADVLILVSAILALLNIRQYAGGRLYRPWFWIMVGKTILAATSG